MAYDPAVLEHVFWAALSGPHAAFASGSGAARRYVAGFSPFLHVMHDNPAHQLYQRMGFRDFRHTVVRVLART